MSANIDLMHTNLLGIIVNRIIYIGVIVNRIIYIGVIVNRSWIIYIFSVATKSKYLNHTITLRLKLPGTKAIRDQILSKSSISNCDS